MSKAAVRAGVVGGIIGGVVMAIWLTFILWLTGIGFWTLLNLIANTFWRGAPLGPQFSGTAVVIGLVVHVLMSVLFGMLIALAAWRLPAPRSLVIAGGAFFGSALWAVMQYGIWRAADPAAARVVTPWVFASAHLLFGLVVASMAAIVITDDEAQPAAGRMSDAALRNQRATPGVVLPSRTLTARSERGARTVVRTSGGLGVVTDETDGRAGTAPTPLETVIGALCGSASVTFATAARELGFGYAGIEFEASFTQDPRGAAGEPGVRTHFQGVRVQARVYRAEPDAWLPDVVRITERRCPVRNLLADAGVALEMTWTAAARPGPRHQAREPEYLPWQ